VSPTDSEGITVLVHIAPIRLVELAESGIEIGPAVLLAAVLVLAGTGALLRAAHDDDRARVGG
jgi:hypothetical protein